MEHPIKYLDLAKLNAGFGDELTDAAQRVLTGGWYLLGNETKAFEEEYAAFIGTKHCITCANGLDALTLILRAWVEMGVMQPGDEVIVPAHTYVASLLAITESGLVPRLVEPRMDTFQIDDSLIEDAITPRTRAVMIVHLYGYCAFTERIAALCSKHGLRLIEDNAQAHGCRCGERRTGALGDAAGHSFYPGKNLGALGDAGAVTTDDDDLAQMVRTLANYGSSKKYVFPHKGRNSRMDEVQAAMLRVKLRRLDADNAARRAMALRLVREVSNPAVTLPSEAFATHSVHHIFPVLSPHRDALQAFLAARGIETLIHYPIPPHRQQCYAELSHLSLPLTERIHREELSLPLNPVLTAGEIDRIIAALNAWSPLS